MENGSANLLSLRLVFSRNSVDNPSIRGAVRSSAPRCRRHCPLLAVGRQGLQQFDAERFGRYKWIEFHKWQFKAQWFFKR